MTLSTRRLGATLIAVATIGLGAAPAGAMDDKPHGLTASGRAVATYCRAHERGGSISMRVRERSFFGQAYIRDRIRAHDRRARRLGKTLVRNHPSCPLPFIRGALRT